MPKRSLPQAAATALDIIRATGGREIRANDFQLLMHQRGFDSRAVIDALNALERRGWLLRKTGTIEVSQAALEAKAIVRKKAAQKTRSRMPRDIFR